MNRKARSSRSAFTMVESTVALAVGILVVGAALGLLVWGVKSCSRTDDRLDPAERAHLAFATLRQVLCDSVAYAQDGDDLVFCGLRGKGVVRFDSTRGKLSLQLPGQSRFTELVSSGVKAFAVNSPSPGVLRLGMELARPRSTGRVAGLPSLRVCDEIFIPAVALRYDPLPWNSAGRA